MKPAASIDMDSWMAQTQTRTVMNALIAGGKPARFVGGCVRDALLGLPVQDIDIATPEPPERVTDLIERAGLRAIPTGIDHGTITAICDGIPFEITTLRRDVETFGRHARVSFTTDWLEDAARRDLTLNALYCDRDGTVFDPVGGLADLKQGRIRFVGDAHERIQEDVLRLLRFFRFFAYYGVGEADENAIEACKRMAPQLASLSIERVWKELSRLLLAPDPAATLEIMATNGILSHLLPEAIHSGRLPTLIRAEVSTETGPDYLRRMATIVDLDKDGVQTLAARLKLSNADRDQLCDLCNPRTCPNPLADPKANRDALYRLGPNLFRDLVLIGEASFPEQDWLSLFSLPETSPVPGFLVTGQDVVDMGVPAGTEIGNLLEQVEEWWIAGNFEANRETCLKHLRSLVTARS
ncbi:MAG: CCA tRNA nucleotidyltransferase [Alphaproteobacteria bacterium]|nr:CCA tRNA nucleotidyltransferase [Alphaproteobacteria bacterium]